MQVAGRKIRASWQQCVAYAVGISLAVAPFAKDHDWKDLMKMEHFFEFIAIAGGSLLLAGARSFIQRKPWEGPERAEKTLELGKETPPSV